KSIAPSTPASDKVPFLPSPPVPQTEVLFSTRTNLLDTVGYGLDARVFFCNARSEGLIIADPYPMFNSRHLFDYRHAKDKLDPPPDGLYFYQVLINEETWFWPTGPPGADESRPIDFNPPPRPICLQLGDNSLSLFPFESNVIEISPRAPAP